jgi:hypothetical protein
MLKNKVIFSSRFNSALLYVVIILLIINSGCHNISQNNSAVAKLKDPSSALQVSHGINIEKISTEKFTPVGLVRITLPKDAGPVLKNISSVFARQVQQRCKAKVAEDLDAVLTVELAIEPGIGAEGFRIEDGKAGTIRIIGNDERGTLYGIGKFLRTSRYDQGGFTAGTWRGTSVPEKPVRGIYLATHFHNFYESAPVAEVQQYVEDLGLWGYNVVLLWYDMHLANGFNDPLAVSSRVRLHAIYNAAHAIGLDAAWGDIANGGYGNSPDSIRAVNCGRGAQFKEDVCPSKPGGTEYILENAAKLLKEFSDVKPKYYFIWPYDNGGCDCEKCRPWGTNGYLRTARLLAEQQRKFNPESRTILGTWLFSHSEWLEINKMFSAQPPEYVDYMMNEWLNDGTTPVGSPGGFPALSFPEITMLGWQPWGGYGATPLPERYQAEWRNRSSVLSGGFPYSEGIYDDINKIMFAQFYWKPDRSAADILKEYIAFEYSPNVVDEIIRVVGILEHNFKREEIQQSAEDAFLLIQKSEEKMTLQAQLAWRWRILALRALIDQEIFRTSPRPVFKQVDSRGRYTATIYRGEALSQAFTELSVIYHTEKTDRKDVNEVWMLPPKVVIDNKKTH